MSDRITQATATVGYGVSESASKVLRNTYMLLSMTLFFSAGMTALAVSTQAPPMHWLLSLGGMIGLLFALQAMRNSIWALPLVFAFTGFMGWSLGPMISYYLQSPGGASIVGNALFGTAAVFLSLSAYVLTTKKDFSFMGGFLMVGIVLAIVASLANIFLAIPALSLAVSAAIIMIMSGFILFDTSRIVNGGETNYIMATVSLYLSLYNIFVSLLQILGVFGSDD